MRHRTGRTGPSGGPEMTDVIGHVVAVGADAVTVERRDGTQIDVRLAALVTWKVVPPPPPGARASGLRG